MWGVIFWVLVPLLFLVEATPTWLLVILAGFSAYAVGQIMGLLFTLPLDQVLALPAGMFAGDRWALASFALLACVALFLQFYRKLWIACEVRLVLIQRQRGNKR